MSIPQRHPGGRTCAEAMLMLPFLLLALPFKLAVRSFRKN